MEKLKIKYPVIVEGKYDRLTLDRVIDADILTTDGFGIFKNTEKQALLRALAQKTPLIVLTDPDGAGGVIRSRISGMIPPERRIMLYVPKVAGKEKRKAAPSKEGYLGVEGTDADLLYRLFEKYAGDSPAASGQKITAADLCEFGLTGGAGAQEQRDRFGARFSLPAGMNAKAFLSALNYLCTPEEYRAEAALFRKEETS